MKQNIFFEIEKKIVSNAHLADKIKLWRSKKKKIIFTNGCFDLLHYGHVHYLCGARSLGDALIVGVNSDASVKKLKGELRPINDELSRCTMLAAFGFVDAVIVFEEDTPVQLIEKIQPDVLVKGGDYTIETIVGADIVLKNGGSVKVIPFVEGFSSTKIVEAILKKA